MRLHSRPFAVMAALAACVALLIASLAVAPAHAAAGTVSVSGSVWDDTDRDGVRDAGEQGWPDFAVLVLDPDGNVVPDPDNPYDDLVVYVDADGAYGFPQLPVLAAGQAYQVAVVPDYDVYDSTTGLARMDTAFLRPTEADLSAPGASDTGVDFALVRKPPRVAVCGSAWDDVNRDGERDITENSLQGLSVTIAGPDMNVISGPADPTAEWQPVTDDAGLYCFGGLPPIPAGESYTVTLAQPPAGYESTTGLEPAGDGFRGSTTSDLSVDGGYENINFALAAADGDPTPTHDWLVMPYAHSDVLYPEVDTAADGAQSLQLRAHVDTLQPMDWDDLVIAHTDATKETLPQQYTPSADYSFIGPAGSTDYRSRLEGIVPNGSPWIGAATQSPTLDVFAPEHVLSFRLDAVTGYHGEDAPGDVVLWQSDAPKNGSVLFSTKTGLPQALSFGKGKHTHFNWSFTQPGIYCMAFSVQTQMPDGSRQRDRGILTQIVGSDYDPATIEPCGRHLDYPSQPAKPVTTGTGSVPVVSGDNSGSFSLALDAQQQLRATYEEAATYADGPPTSYPIDDVILYGKAGLDHPYRLHTGSRGARNLSWDTLRIGDSALDGDITWKIDSVRGPGEFSVTNAGEWSDQRFDTANGAMAQTLWAGAVGNFRGPRWEVTRPGKYCVAMTWSATTADGQAVSDQHVLTLVAEGPLDPNDYDPAYRETGKDSPYAGPVWRAADHGALDQTCAQGGQPTAADEVPVPGDGTPPGGPDWDVPNWSRTDSGALILSDGHLDLASTLDGGTFDTQVKDTTDEGQIHATHDGASWHDPADVVLQVRPDAATTVPADDRYAFLGAAGSRAWIISETQQPGLLWPGWSTETIPTTATQGGVTWSLDRMTGPGEFALYVGGATLGSVDVRFNTRDGISGADSFVIPKNTHAHGNWAFSAEGTYCLGFTRSAVQADGKPVSDTFSLAVAVGETEVKKVDPTACFAATGEPPTDSAWNVKNRSVNKVGATVLNSGHVDIASVIRSGALATRIKDTTRSSDPVWRLPTKTVLQLLPESRRSVPSGSQWRFLGAAGTSYYQASQARRPGLLRPGWSTRSVPRAATTGGVRWTLKHVSGPGRFALYRMHSGMPSVFFNTRNGIDARDSFVIPKGARVHGSWAFSAAGTYCLTMRRSTRLSSGKSSASTFVLAFAVGTADVSRVDPARCGRTA